jgi:hypothetical protein
MRVPTSFTILGYPGFAMLFFLAAGCGAILLLAQIIVTDVRQSRARRTPRGGASPAHRDGSNGGR